jgi:hypothetical protein
LKAVAVGGHASILASLAISGSGANIKLSAESESITLISRGSPKRALVGVGT